MRDNDFTIPRSGWNRAILGLLGFLWKLWPLAVVGLLVLWGTCAHFHCTAHEQTRRILERDGYEEIEVGNHAWFDCGESDIFSNTFSAEKNGKRAEGAVCCGLFKNCTVRFE